MIKSLHELALQTGRRFQSDQTGFIHFNYHANEEKGHETIPLVENFLFVYALLRSRVADNMSEAKVLLDRLLYFQNVVFEEHAGNFPVYLHQYPFCPIRTVAVPILVTMSWIERDFIKLFETPLKNSFRAALQRTKDFCSAAVEKRKLSYKYALCVAAAVGDKELYEQLEPTDELHEWWETDTLGWLFLAEQLQAGTGGDESTFFIDHLRATWSPQAFSYVGPATAEVQERGEPKVDLYDLIMGFLSGEYSHRSLEPHPIHLWGALVHTAPKGEASPRPPYTLEGEHNGAPWRSFVQREGACSVIGRQGPPPPAEVKTFTPLRIVWGNREMTHSCVAQGDRAASIAWKKGGEQVELLYSLEEEFDPEDRQKSREIAFFFDKTAGLETLVEGKYATTFRLGEKVTFQSKRIAIALTLTLEEGEGDFMGHIMPGNRPSQVAAQGGRQYDAFDWHVFLRTLRRGSVCKVMAKIEYKFL